MNLIEQPRRNYEYVRQFETELKQTDRQIEAIESRLFGPEKLTSAKFVQLIEQRNILLYKLGLIKQKLYRAHKGRNPWGTKIETIIINLEN